MMRYATFTEFETNAQLIVNVDHIAKVRPFDLKTGLVLDRNDHWTFVNETREEVERRIANACPL